jgi:hypothetical protein
VTTETEPVDPIAQGQAELDTAQEGTLEDAPQYVTAEEFSSMRGTIERLSNENRGLQSKIDRGLDAIRRDSEERVRQEAEQKYRNQLDRMPEDIREYMEPVLRENMEARIRADQQAASRQESPSTSQPANNQLNYLLDNLKIDRNDPAVQAVINDPSPTLTNEQREERFWTVVRTRTAQPDGSGQAPQRAPLEPTQRKTPPIGGQPTSTASSGSAEANRDLFITGRIDADEYRKREAAAGRSV